MEVWRKKRKLVAFLFVGFVIGVLYIVLFGDPEGDGFLMSQYFISRYRQGEPEGVELMRYVWKARIPILIFLWLMGITVLGNAAVLLFSLWCGFSLGLILTMTISQLGMAGLFLCVLGMFPHYLIYVPVYGYGLLRIYEMGDGKRTGKAYLGTLILVVSLTLFGILVECYVNPMLLRIFLKNF